MTWEVTFQVDADFLLPHRIGSHQEATHRACKCRERCSCLFGRDKGTNGIDF